MPRVAAEERGSYAAKLPLQHVATRLRRVAHDGDLCDPFHTPVDRHPSGAVLVAKLACACVDGDEIQIDAILDYLRKLTLFERTRHAGANKKASSRSSTHDAAAAKLFETKKNDAQRSPNPLLPFTIVHFAALAPNGRPLELIMANIPLIAAIPVKDFVLDVNTQCTSVNANSSMWDTSVIDDDSSEAGRSSLRSRAAVTTGLVVADRHRNTAALTGLPLHVAASRGSLATAVTLLVFGANPRLNRDGCISPLHEAAAYADSLREKRTLSPPTSPRQRASSVAHSDTFAPLALTLSNTATVTLDDLARNPVIDARAQKIAWKLAPVGTGIGAAAVGGSGTAKRDGRDSASASDCASVSVRSHPMTPSSAVNGPSSAALMQRHKSQHSTTVTIRRGGTPMTPSPIAFKSGSRLEAPSLDLPDEAEIDTRLCELLIRSGCDPAAPTGPGFPTRVQSIIHLAAKRIRAKKATHTGMDAETRNALHRAPPRRDYMSTVELPPWTLARPELHRSQFDSLASPFRVASDASGVSFPELGSPSAYTGTTPVCLDDGGPSIEAASPWHGMMPLRKPFTPIPRRLGAGRLTLPLAGIGAAARGISAVSPTVPNQATSENNTPGKEPDSSMGRHQSNSPPPPPPVDYRIDVDRDALGVADIHSGEVVTVAGKLMPSSLLFLLQLDERTIARSAHRAASSSIDGVTNHVHNATDHSKTTTPTAAGRTHTVVHAPTTATLLAFERVDPAIPVCRRSRRAVSISSEDEAEGYSPGSADDGLSLQSEGPAAAGKHSQQPPPPQQVHASFRKQRAIDVGSSAATVGGRQRLSFVGERDATNAAGRGRMSAADGVGMPTSPKRGGPSIVSDSSNAANKSPLKQGANVTPRSGSVLPATATLEKSRLSPTKRSLSQKQSPGRPQEVVSSPRSGAADDPAVLGASLFQQMDSAAGFHAAPTFQLLRGSRPPPPQGASQAAPVSTAVAAALRVSPIDRRRGGGGLSRSLSPTRRDASPRGGGQQQAQMAATVESAGQRAMTQEAPDDRARIDRTPSPPPHERRVDGGGPFPVPLNPNWDIGRPRQPMGGAVRWTEEAVCRNGTDATIHAAATAGDAAATYRGVVAAVYELRLTEAGEAMVANSGDLRRALKIGARSVWHRCQRIAVLQIERGRGDYDGDRLLNKDGRDDGSAASKRIPKGHVAPPLPAVLDVRTLLKMRPDRDGWRHANFIVVSAADVVGGHGNKGHSRHDGAHGAATTGRSLSPTTPGRTSGVATTATHHGSSPVRSAVEAAGRPEDGTSMRSGAASPVVREEGLTQHIVAHRIRRPRA